MSSSMRKSCLNVTFSLPRYKYRPVNPLNVQIHTHHAYTYTHMQSYILTRCWEIDIYMYNLCEIGVYEIGVCGIGVCEIGLCEIGLCEIGLCEIGVCEIWVCKIG